MKIGLRVLSEFEKSMTKSREPGARLFIRIPLESVGINATVRYGEPLWAVLRDGPIGGGLLGRAMPRIDTPRDWHGYHCHLYEGIELTVGLQILFDTLKRCGAPEGTVILHGETEYQIDPIDEE